MSFGASHIVFLLTVAVLALSMIAIVARSFEGASYCMVGVASCLTLVYITYAIAIDNPYLYIWAAIYAVTRIWFLPFFKGGLLYTARRMPPETSSKAPVWGTIIFASVALGIMLVLSVESGFSLVVSAQPLDQLGETISLNLLLAAFLILYGITVLLTHRHPFRMVLGILLMEAGIHLSLVHLVPKLLAMVQVGIFSNFVGSIFLVLYINRLIVQKLKVTDTAQLSDLKH